MTFKIKRNNLFVFTIVVLVATFSTCQACYSSGIKFLLRRNVQTTMTATKEKKCHTHATQLDGTVDLCDINDENARPHGKTVLYNPFECRYMA